MSQQNRVPGICADCDRDIEIVGRRLCARCYARHYRAGTLGQFVHGKRDVAQLFLDDFATLARRYSTRAQIAEHLGTSLETLDRRISRMRQRGYDVPRIPRKVAA